MKISRNKNKNNSGFTLVELVDVIAGLAALAGISIPNFLNTFLSGNWVILSKEFSSKLPSFVNKYAESKDLKKVFPLLGYEANQIIINFIYHTFFLKKYKKLQTLHLQF